MSFSRTAAVSSLVLVGTLALHQNYLSTENTQSPYYWRNLHSFSDMMFQLSHYKHLDFILSLSKVIVAADFDTSQFIAFMLALPKMRVLRRLFDKLDDIVDGSTATAVVSLGEATLGIKPSPFLNNLLDQEDLHDIKQIVTSGLITMNEMISFCNLLANKLYIQAKLTILYTHSNDASEKALLRKRIAGENLEISGCYLALLIHFVKKDPRLTAIINNPTHKGLTYHDLKLIYERCSEAGELIQIAHDVPEFRYDLRQEPMIGKISANYFLAELEAANVLQETKNVLSQLPDRPLAENELPAPVKTVLAHTELHYMNRAAKLGTTLQFVYSNIWRYEKLVGFFSAKPRRNDHQTAEPPKLIISKL